MAGGVAFADLQSLCALARTAAQNQDFVLLRQYLVEGKFIIAALGDTVSASQTQVALSMVAELQKDIEELQLYVFKTSSRSRVVRTRVGDERRRHHGQFGGVAHDG